MGLHTYRDFAAVSGRKTFDVSKVSKFCFRKSEPDLNVSEIKYFLPGLYLVSKTVQFLANPVDIMYSKWELIHRYCLHCLHERKSLREHS